jgi:hypothetical protein
MTTAHVRSCGVRPARMGRSRSGRHERDPAAACVYTRRHRGGPPAAEEPPRERRARHFRCIAECDAPSTSTSAPLGQLAHRMLAGASSRSSEQMRPLAAELLDASPDALHWDRERCGFATSGSFAALAQLAAFALTQALRLPAGSRSGVEATHPYDHPLAALPGEDGRDWELFAPIFGHAVHVASSRSTSKRRRGHPPLHRRARLRHPAEPQGSARPGHRRRRPRHRLHAQRAAELHRGRPATRARPGPTRPPPRCWACPCRDCR